MRVDIELTPDEVKAAVVAYLRSRGLPVLSAEVTHATGADVVEITEIEHNYDTNRLMLNVTADLGPLKPVTRSA